MKKTIRALAAVLLVAVMLLCAMGSGEKKTVDKGKDTVSTKPAATEAAVDDDDDDRLGEYSVVIDSCRLAKDYEGKDVVIVKYIFTNVEDDDAASFSFSISDKVYQNGIELEGSYFLDDSANYDSGSSTKSIKKGVTIEVEQAYELNDTKADVEVEVSELISLNRKTITKTFSISQ